MDVKDEEKYIRAKERVAEIKEFYSKVVSHLITIAIVAGINYYVNEFRNPWFLWVVFGLGISIVIKAAKTFGVMPFMGRDWEKKKIKELMDEEDGDQKRWK